MNQYSIPKDEDYDDYIESILESLFSQFEGQGIKCWDQSDDD